MNKICFNCKKPFKAREHDRKFCSSKCYHDSTKGKSSWNKGKKRWWSSPTEFKKGHPAPKTAFYKGQPAWNKGKKCPWCTGAKNFNFNNYRINDCGYIAVLSPNHPHKNNKGYVREHRLVAEKCLGRFLTKKEIIHHINGIITDNRPENLYLFSDQCSHSIFHQHKHKLTSNFNILKEQNKSQSHP